MECLFDINVLDHGRLALGSPPVLQPAASDFDPRGRPTTRRASGVHDHARASRDAERNTKREPQGWHPAALKYNKKDLHL